MVISEELREQAYKKAEEILKENGIGYIEVDKRIITYCTKTDEIKVYMIPWKIKHVDRGMLKKIKECPMMVITHDRYKKVRLGEIKRTTEAGYLLIPLEMVVQ